MYVVFQMRNNYNKAKKNGWKTTWDLQKSIIKRMQELQDHMIIAMA